MKAFNRKNLKGELFCIVEMERGRTLVRLLHNGGKFIVVNEPVDKVVIAWHQWINGASIHEAFPMLGEWDKEFIITAIPRNEYERILAE